MGGYSGNGPGLDLTRAKISGSRTPQRSRKVDVEELEEFPFEVDALKGFAEDEIVMEVYVKALDDKMNESVVSDESDEEYAGKVLPLDKDIVGLRLVISNIGY